MRRLSTIYDVRSLPELLSSYDNATAGSGSVLNQVQFAYNDFGQTTTSYQTHGGAVNTSTTPKVQYSFANGSANTVRPDSITYPDGRVVALDYGSTDSVADILSRPAGIKSNASSVTEYQYLGLASPVIVDHVEPDVEYTLVGTAGGDDPATGDIYRGLDRFGRVKDAYWYDYGASSDAARIQYGYDRASNRTYRDDIVATAQSKAFDELYDYDGLHRLQDMGRGTLNGGKTALTTEITIQ